MAIQQVTGTSPGMKITVGETRAQALDLNAILMHFHIERFGKAFKEKFGGRIHRAAGCRHIGCQGGHVDDRAGLPGNHLGKDGIDEFEGGDHMDL